MIDGILSTALTWSIFVFLASHVLIWKARFLIIYFKTRLRTLRDFICISTHSGIAESDKSTCLSKMHQTEKPPIPSNTHRSLGARTLNVQVSTLPFLQSCFHACLVFPFAVSLPLSPRALFPVCGIKPWWYTYRSFSLFVLILFVSPSQRTEDSGLRFCGSVWGETEEAPRSSWKQAA